MPLSHTCIDGATGNGDHLDQILSDLGRELRRLSERAPGEQDFERFEGELHQLMATAERALLALELEQLDVDRPAVTIAGQRHLPRDNQGENVATIKMRMPRRLAAL